MINPCACLGPMYGEPLCPCAMDAKPEIPKNLAAREADRKQFEEGFKRWLEEERDNV